MSQPVWMNAPPMCQVGPDGSVNLDQSMMAPAMPYAAAQPIPYGGPIPGSMPVTLTPVPTPTYAGDANCAAQPGATFVPAPVDASASALVVPGQPGIAPTFAPPVIAPPISPVASPAMVQPGIVGPTVVVAPLAPPFTWTLFGEALYLHPTGVDMAHAQQQNGGVPAGIVGVADPSYDIGFRVGGEWQYDPCAAVFASYAFFEESTDSVLAPRPGQGVGSLVHQFATGPDGTLRATYDIEFQTGDIAYRRYLVQDIVGKVSVFAGGRFAHLDQRFFQTSSDEFNPPGEIINTTTNIEFNGGGPMAGIDAARTIGASGFSVYGRALAAAILGQFDSHYRMVATDPTVLLAEVIWEDDRIVPMLDYELGLAWTSPLGHFRFSAGYMVSHWFNAVTTPVFVDAVQAENYVDVSDTISFDGLVGRAEVRW
jgi:hypothetical protein